MADELERRKWSMLGTFRKQNQAVPVDTPNWRREDVNKTRYLYRGNKALCSFCPKAGRVVLLLSTAGHGEDQHSESNKQQIIEDYNMNKSGMDIFNEIIKNRTCQRKTRRWPLRTFYFLIDVSVPTMPSFYSGKRIVLIVSLS